MPSCENINFHLKAKKEVEELLKRKCMGTDEREKEKNFKFASRDWLNLCNRHSAVNAILFAFAHAGCKKEEERSVGKLML